MGNHLDKRLDAVEHNGNMQTVLTIKTNANGEMQVNWNSGNPFEATELLSKAQITILNYAIKVTAENSKKENERRIIVP